MKKILAILLLAVLMLGLLPTAMAETNPYLYDGSDVTITYWHSFSNDDYVGVINQIIEDFQAKYPNIHVNAEYIGSYNDIHTALASANAAGVGLPTVATINVPRLTSYAVDNMVDDLTPYFSANSMTMDDYYDGMIDMMNINGIQTALPWGQSGQIFYYNKSVICDQLGLTFPATWDEMDAYVNTVYEKTGKPAFSVVANDNAYFYCLFTNQNAFMIDGDYGTKTGLDTDAAKALIKQLQTWAQEGKIQWLYTDAGNTAKLNFTTGETMGVLYTSTLYGTYMKNSQFEVGIALPPKGETQNHYVAGATLIMPRLNDQMQKNAGFLFMEFMTHTEYQLKWAAATSYLPTRKSAVADTAAYEEYLKGVPELRNILDHLDLYVAKTKSPLFDKCGDIFEDLMAQICNEGMDAEEGWQQLVDEINDCLSDQ